MRKNIPDRESHVARWRASGLSRSAYCRKAGLSYQRFCGWTRTCAEVRPSSKSVPSAFIEVSGPASAPAGSQAASVSIQLTCGTTLRVQQGADPAWVGSLAAAVRGC